LEGGVYYIEEQTTQWPKEKGQTTIFVSDCRSLFFLFFLLSFYLEFRYLNLTKLIIETLNTIELEVAVSFVVNDGSVDHHSLKILHS
jgi:hypothetical protein